jgi:SAM-dependent methyltransferase
MKPERSDIADVKRQVRGFLGGIEAMIPQDELRKHYDYLEASDWRYAATLAVIRSEFGRPLNGVGAVDIGAFPGHLSAVLSRIDGAAVTAVTLITTPAFQKFMSHAGVALACCDVERDPLPVEDGEAALVVCSELIEHLDGDVENMLKEARRSVSPDGLFILTTPNHASLQNRWSLVRGRSVYPRLDLPDYPFYAGAGNRNPMRHVREFTAIELRGLLARAGFTRISTTTMSPPAGEGRGLSWKGKLSTGLIRLALPLVANGGTLLVAVARP